MYKHFPRLSEITHRLAGYCSGGEQQMIAIARALMAAPKMLMLDEPSLGLAPQMVDTIFSIIEELQSEGMSILLVEQNVSQALAISDRGYVIEEGRLALAGAAPRSAVR